MKLEQAKKIHHNLTKTYQEAIRFLDLHNKRLRVNDIILLIHLKKLAEGKSISELIKYKMQLDLGDKEYADNEINCFKVKITKRIQRYICMNLIVLKPYEKDKRTKHVYITKFGNTIIDKVNNKVEEIWKEKYENEI